MTEEKLKLKRVTDGKFHNRSLVFHFEMDETFLDTGPDFAQNFGHIEILPLQTNSNFQRMKSRG